MKVYAVSVNIQDYQSARLKEQNLAKAVQMRFDCLPIKNWDIPTLTIIDKSKKRGNFIHFQNGTFIIDDEAYYYLSFAMDNNGEVWPVQLEGETRKYYLYNITTCLDCLNKKKSTKKSTKKANSENWATAPATQEKFYIEQYHFYQGKLSGAKFLKIPEQNQRIFIKQDIVFDRSGRLLYPGRTIIPQFLRGTDEIEFAKEDLKSEIISIIEEHNFTGLNFEEVWRSS